MKLDYTGINLYKIILHNHEDMIDSMIVQYIVRLKANVIAKKRKEISSHILLSNKLKNIRT